jgi:hypothetical protein
MTTDDLLKLLGFLIAFAGAVGGIYWRFSSAIAEVRAELAAHKLHVSESYATKAGMAEQTAQLLRAIESIGSRIDSISERIDRAFESRPTRRSS